MTIRVARIRRGANSLTSAVPIGQHARPMPMPPPALTPTTLEVEGVGINRDLAWWVRRQGGDELYVRQTNRVSG